MFSPTEQEIPMSASLPSTEPDAADDASVELGTFLHRALLAVAVHHYS